MSDQPACYSPHGFTVHSFGEDPNVLVGTLCIYGCGHAMTEVEAMHRLRNIAAAKRLEAARCIEEAERLAYRANSMANRLAKAE